MDYALESFWKGDSLKIEFEQTKQILATVLHYQFKSDVLLKQALTHRSAGTALHNERLEFLGDSVVNFVIAEQLYQQFPNANEGELSRLRASLVNREALASLAKQFNLGDYLSLGLGEEKSGGRSRPSILSCGMEAMIGAIYLDGGFSDIKTCILEWYQPHLSSLSLNFSHKDPKTCLQELLQAISMDLPHYEVILAEGEAHNQTFTVVCSIAHHQISTQACGKSRKRAEQEAAKLMLEKIKNLKSEQKQLFSKKISKSSIHSPKKGEYS